MSRGDSSQIARGRVTVRASTRAVEVLLASLSIAGLQIGRIDALASALAARTGGAHCILPLCMNERDQGGNLVIRAIKRRHALLKTAIAYNWADLVAVQIGCHQLGARQIRTTLASGCIASMTKRTILLKESFAFLNNFRGIGFFR